MNLPIIIAPLRKLIKCIKLTATIDKMIVYVAYMQPICLFFFLSDLWLYPSRYLLVFAISSISKQSDVTAVRAENRKAVEESRHM